MTPDFLERRGHADEEDVDTAFANLPDNRLPFVRAEEAVSIPGHHRAGITLLRSLDEPADDLFLGPEEEDPEAMTSSLVQKSRHEVDTSDALG